MQFDRIVSFDKFHVLDIGIKRQFCDLTNTVLSKSSSLHLSRTIDIVNLPFTTVSLSCHLTSHKPFSLSIQESQSSIIEKIRRLSVTSLLFFLMFISDSAPDDDPLLQCAFQWHVISDVLCNSSKWTQDNIRSYQSYFFRFDVLMSRTLSMVVSTKLYRLMQNVDNHFVHLGCNRGERGSSEETKMVHKNFKCLCS